MDGDRELDPIYGQEDPGVRPYGEVLEATQQEPPAKGLKKFWRRVLGRRDSLPPGPERGNTSLPTAPEEGDSIPEGPVTREQAELIAAISEVMTDFHGNPGGPLSVEANNVSVRNIREGNITPVIRSIIKNILSQGVEGLSKLNSIEAAKQEYLLSRLEELVHHHFTVLSPEEEITVGKLSRQLQSEKARTLQAREGRRDEEMKKIDKKTRDLARKEEELRIRKTLRANGTTSGGGEEIKALGAEIDVLREQVRREAPQRAEALVSLDEQTAAPLVFLIGRIDLVDPEIWKGYLNSTDVPHPLAAQIKEEIGILKGMNVDTKKFSEMAQRRWGVLQQKAATMGREYVIHPLSL